MSETSSAQLSNPNSPKPDPIPETENGAFTTDSVIAAQPISVVAPSETTEATPRKAGRVRSNSNPDEMAKRPSWLPEDWKMELKTRTSGSTAGVIDRYYYAPTRGRKFRSKNEVMKYLEKENKSKDNSNSNADSEPSESPDVSQIKRKRKSNTKTDAEVADVTEPSESPVIEKKRKRKPKSKTDAEPSSTPANGKPKKLRPKRKKLDAEIAQPEQVPEAEEGPQPEETIQPEEVPQAEEGPQPEETTQEI